MAKNVRQDSYCGGDELNIWQLGPRPDLISKPARRRVEFGAVGDTDSDSLFARETITQKNDHSLTVAIVEDDNDENKIKSGVFGAVHLLSENIILHPFIVIRRQCQVSRRSFKYHLTPFTVVPLLLRLDSKQGINTLWKGVGSILITKGILLSTESVLTEFTSLNRSCKINTESICKHLMLKTIAFTIATPFFCSSCIETVQSSVASETPGIFDCLKEGLMRFTYWRRSNSTRLLPFWVITGPTIAYHVLHYAVSSVTKSLIMWSKSKSDSKKENSSCSELNDVSSTVIGTFVADVVLFPLETIIFRLYLQGTRTLVDSVDNANRVIPIISDYEGPIDCYKNIVAEEGSAGLFKGFGSLVLQYVFHFAILRVTNAILREILPNNKKVDI